MNLLSSTGSFKQHPPGAGIRAGFVQHHRRCNCVVAQYLPKIETVSLWGRDTRLAFTSDLDDYDLIASHRGRGVVGATEGVMG